MNKKLKETDKLYLSIRPISFAHELPLIYKKLNDDLIIVLKSTDSINASYLPKNIQKDDGETLDVTGTTAYVLQKDVSKYGISEYKLFEIALDNFHKLKMELNSIGENKEIKMMDPKWENTNKYGEDIVQSHLLSKYSLHLLKEKLGNEFYVRISNYETFVAIRKNISKRYWNAIKIVSQRNYKSQPHPLSDKLFLYSGGKLFSVKDF